jgi:hypothetical protein
MAPQMDRSHRLMAIIGISFCFFVAEISGMLPFSFPGVTVTQNAVMKLCI